ncbi:hypothetical protein ACIQF6_06725 [Kitasatospora sp. NPDC092948]
MKCIRCNTVRPDVEIVVDPYVREMTGESKLVTLCGDCYGDLCDEI